MTPVTIKRDGVKWVRCAVCNRLLSAYAIGGNLIVQIRCPHCGMSFETRAAETASKRR